MTDPNADNVNAYVIGSDKRVIYSAIGIGDAGDGADIPKLEQDKTGNVMVAVGLGAHSGLVVVLRVTADGVKDFGSKPDLDSFGKFGGSSPAEVKDTDGDGINEIISYTNDYEPDYATGTRYATTWKWNGSDYKVSACAKNEKSFAIPANGLCYDEQH